MKKKFTIEQETAIDRMSVIYDIYAIYSFKGNAFIITYEDTDGIMIDDLEVYRVNREGAITALKKEREY